MFIIKSIHAKPSADKKGQTAVKLTLTATGFCPLAEGVIPATALTGEESIGKAVEIVNARISPVIQDRRILWQPDLQPLLDKIKSVDKDFFTEDGLGQTLFREVAALITDMFNRDLLLSQSSL